MPRFHRKRDGKRNQKDNEEASHDFTTDAGTASYSAATELPFVSISDQSEAESKDILKEMPSKKTTSSRPQRLAGLLNKFGGSTFFSSSDSTANTNARAQMNVQGVKIVRANYSDA